MRYASLILFSAAVLAASAAIAGDEVFDLDAAQTQVEYTLGDVLHTVHGSFKVKQGTVHFDPETGKASGEIVVDAKSGNSGSGARDGRMHKNILESAKYPEISFAPDRIEGKVEPQGTSQVQVHGAFTIHGAAHELTAPAELTINNGQVIAKLHFVVPYVSWGMKNPSNFLLKVNDKVDIDITAQGHLQVASTK